MSLSGLWVTVQRVQPQGGKRRTVRGRSLRTPEPPAVRAPVSFLKCGNKHPGILQQKGARRGETPRPHGCVGRPARDRVCGQDDDPRPREAVSRHGAALLRGVPHGVHATCLIHVCSKQSCKSDAFWLPSSGLEKQIQREAVLQGAVQTARETCSEC